MTISELHSKSKLFMLLTEILVQFWLAFPTDTVVFSLPNCCATGSRFY